jgi:hypothetical protein
VSARAAAAAAASIVDTAEAAAAATTTATGAATTATPAGAAEAAKAAVASSSSTFSAALATVAAELHARLSLLASNADVAFAAVREAAVAAIATAASAVAAQYAAFATAVGGGAPFPFSSFSSSSSSSVAILAFGAAVVIAAVWMLWRGLSRRRGDAGGREREAVAYYDDPNSSNSNVGGSSDARRDAVLVLGATGRTGREVVRAVLAGGRQVVAGVRSADKAREVFDDAFVATALAASASASSGGGGGGKGKGKGDGLDGFKPLVIQSGVDVTNPKTLTPQLFAGVSQVITCVGSIFGPVGPGSAFGYVDGMTSERVDARGVPNVVEAFVTHAGSHPAGRLPRLRKRLACFDTMKSISQWRRDDENTIGSVRSGSFWPPDVFSTGWTTPQKPSKKSSAEKRAAPEPEPEGMEEMTYGVWEGELVEEEPGIAFCGCRWTPDQPRPTTTGGGGGLSGAGGGGGGFGGGGGEVGAGAGGGSEPGAAAVAELDSVVSTTVRINLGAYEGLELRVKGDGQRYKVRLWTGEPPAGDRTAIAAASVTAQVGAVQFASS